MHWQAASASVPVMCQVDTLGKKVLVGIAFAYVGVVLLLPFVNVFYQARFSPCRRCCLARDTRPSHHSSAHSSHALAMTMSVSWSLGEQAFRNGAGPFIEHLMDEDFLHAVSSHASTYLRAPSTLQVP